MPLLGTLDSWWGCWRSACCLSMVGKEGWELGNQELGKEGWELGNQELGTQILAWTKTRGTLIHPWVLESLLPMAV